jgi:hypothetical protein
MAFQSSLGFPISLHWQPSSLDSIWVVWSLAVRFFVHSRSIFLVSFLPFLVTLVVNLTFCFIFSLSISTCLSVISCNFSFSCRHSLVAQFSILCYDDVFHFVVRASLTLFLLNQKTKSNNVFRKIYEKSFISL